MDDRITRVISELQAYADASDARLRHAVSERNRVVARVSAGDTTVYSHYRMIWLHETSAKLISWIQDETVKFSAKHMSAGDSCTVTDIMDLLRTTLGKFERKT